MKAAALESVTTGQRSCWGERGQALILIAAAALTLAGMLALVVDTGHLYSEQRRMQSAADAAALAAAQNASTSSPYSLNADQAAADARALAGSNGYTSTITPGNGVWDNGVYVSVPPSSGKYAGNQEYVEVMLSRPVDTYFAGVLNVNTVTVTARAVARSKAGAVGAALIALSPATQAIVIGNNITGVGIDVAGNVYAAGSIQCAGGRLTVSPGAAFAAVDIANPCAGRLVADGGWFEGPDIPRIYDPLWPSAVVTDTYNQGVWRSDQVSPTLVIDGKSYREVWPGTYASINVFGDPNVDRVMFHQGVYNLMGSSEIPALYFAGGWVETDGPVQFILANGALVAEETTQGVLNSGPEYNNILIYSQYGPGTAVQATGNTVLTYNGTIYAPFGDVQISGHASVLVNGQVVANRVRFDGNQGSTITANPDWSSDIVKPVLVE